MLFGSNDVQAAKALAAELGSDEDWKARVTTSDGQPRVAVQTRPFILGRAVVVELAQQMAIAAREFGCEVLSIQPAPRKRPWWRFGS